MNGNETQREAGRRPAPRPRPAQPDPAESAADQELGRRLARIYRYLLLRGAETPEQPAEVQA